MALPDSPAVLSFRENMKDVNRLMEIHKELTGDDAGRRHGVEVLNKSAVVLITACWEAFVEDVATLGFDFLLSETDSHDNIPKKVLAYQPKN